MIDLTDSGRHSSKKNYKGKGEKYISHGHEVLKYEKTGVLTKLVLDDLFDVFSFTAAQKRRSLLLCERLGFFKKDKGEDTWFVPAMNGDEVEKEKVVDEENEEEEDDWC